MPFIINEDKALKTLLKGITVSDAKNSARPVGVWFGQPDVEIREQSYPYITIDLVDIIEEKDRSNRGVVTLSYTPEGANSSVKYKTEIPIPVAIDYQVTSYSRQPLHDRAIISALLTNILPFRFGTLEIPEDKTLRRLELLGYTKRDTTEQGKRLYVNVFTIRVSSEILPSTLVAYSPAITTINKTFNTYINTDISNS